MALAPSAATALPPELEPVPLLLPWDLRLTPEQFERVCHANPEAVLELSADGALVAMTPTGGATGSRNGEIAYQLRAFCRRHRDWRMFDSSTGFRLADSSVLSPDGSLLRDDRWLALTPEQRCRFPPLCPELVIELASPSDEGPRGVSALRRKMAHIRPTAPASAGCHFPTSGLWRSGGVVSRGWPSGWTTPADWMALGWPRG